MFTVIMGVLCLLIIIVTLILLLLRADKKFDTLTGEYRELRSTSSGIAEDNLSKAKEIRRLNEALSTQEKEKKKHGVEFKVLSSWNGWTAWIIYGKYEWQAIQVNFKRELYENPEEEAQHWIESFKELFSPLDERERKNMVTHFTNLTDPQKRNFFPPSVDKTIKAPEVEE